MANNIWSNYTQKNTALSDNDEVMLLDSTDEKNKRGLMSKFWDYVVDKMSTAVISKLDTNNKTVIGAINALNSETEKIIYIDGGTYSMDEYSEEQAAQDIIDTKLKNNYIAFYFVTFTRGGVYKMIVQKYLSSNYASYILFGYSTSKLIYHVKTNGVWL